MQSSMCRWCEYRHQEPGTITTKGHMTEECAGWVDSRKSSSQAAGEELVSMREMVGGMEESVGTGNTINKVSSQRTLSLAE